MIESSSNRKFSRIDALCEVALTHPSTGATSTAHSINLSATDVLFKTKNKLSQGISLEISVKPINSATPPLNALIEIVRVTLVDDGEYEVAATIEGIKGT
ncbi:MAG: hypothetical protein A6F72_04405 [Cycloclasticus sp. symbiont of Poecilosclerida sp. N]|nr:MAG: hypothetical protein A6F72_04405 [Cycloclasticus sp. symbiont of Poecilosclerida sp. N]